MATGSGRKGLWPTAWGAGGPARLAVGRDGSENNKPRPIASDSEPGPGGSLGAFAPSATGTSCPRRRPGLSMHSRRHDQVGCRQVFWLPGQPSAASSHPVPNRDSDILRRSSPVTAARPRPILTAFPFRPPSGRQPATPINIPRREILSRREKRKVGRPKCGVRKCGTRNSREHRQQREQEKREPQKQCEVRKCGARECEVAATS
jgi:hypothetical protein